MLFVVLLLLDVPEDKIQLRQIGLDLSEAEDPGGLGADGVGLRGDLLVVRGVEDADALLGGQLLPHKAPHKVPVLKRRRKRRLVVEHGVVAVDLLEDLFTDRAAFPLLLAEEHGLVVHEVGQEDVN